MVKKLNYNNTNFFLSISNINNLPNDNSKEIAFIGRSNTGKSSIINSITGKKIAKVSKNPGCTNNINLFCIKYGFRLVDLPGYGYSDMSKKKRDRLYLLINQYLKIRKNLKGIVIVIDIRHIIKIIDINMINQLVNYNYPILILLNKSDKLSNINQSKQLIKIKEKINNIPILLYSVIRKSNLPFLIKILNSWFK